LNDPNLDRAMVDSAVAAGLKNWPAATTKT
jgi:hypothetical protein